MPAPSEVIAAFAVLAVAIMAAYIGARLIAALLIQLLPDSLLPPHLRAESESDSAYYEHRTDATNRKDNR